MSQERLEILRMVADKIIGVDEAERLLRALDEGERSRRAEGRSTGWARGGAVAGAFGGVGEALGAIGDLVEETVSDAVEGMESEFWLDPEEADCGEVLPETGFALPAGGRLSIRQSSRSLGRSCHLTLLPAEGDRCTIEAEPGADVQVRRDGGRTRVRWRSGSLVVRVPATAAEVEARVMGSDLRAQGLGCPLDARAIGGQLDLSARHPFEVRTTGGDLHLQLEPGLQGVSRASSMGGAVVIAVPEDLGVQVDAAVTGGELRLEPGLGQARQEGRRLHRRVRLDLGPRAANAAQLSIKLMGGDVHIQRRRA